jgi:hypothetical protein
VRTLCSSVLLLQAIVIGLAIPVALALSDVPDSTVLWGGGILVLMCFVSAGLLRSPVGLALGWAVQVGAILSGFVVPTMFFLGGVFALLWYFAIRLGRQGDAATAAHRASLADDAE